MTDLRTAAQQALDDLKDLHTNHNITYAGTIWRLEAALAQEQAEQTWVCPDSPEHRYKKPGHCEDCGKTLVLAQASSPGCDHCRHPLYAATKCRVCGRVTGQAEPVQEPVAWRVRRNDGQYELYFVKASAERAAECYIKRPQVEPLYTAPPQRKPLTQEEIIDATEHIDTSRDGYFIDIARAIERAHKIT